MSTAMPSDVPASTRFLAEPAMRRTLEDFVRRRVPASDVDDVVQTVLVEALASAARPREEDELRRWLLGIARHKVVDHHRRASREAPSEIPDLPAGPPPLEARSLAAWAEQQAGGSNDAKSTLEWMAREGEGEKLEAIAEEEKVPAARIRQRVSRMRRWMKERWLAELAAAAALVVAAIVLWRLFHKEQPIAVPEPRPEPTVAPPIPPEAPPQERARLLRDKAFEDCDKAQWQPCLDKLDEAKRLDPAGDSEPRVGAARQKANDALLNQIQKDGRKNAPAPIQSSAPVPVPSSAPVLQQTSAPVMKKPPAPVKPAPKPQFDDDFGKKSSAKSGRMKK